MTSFWGRLAALIVAALTFSSPKASSSSSNCRSETGSGLTLDADTRYHKAWTDPVPGTKPLFGLNERILDVRRRDCLSNGSNYCFGNNVDFCAGCGNCCVDGNYCCGKGKTCCGSGCCGSDQICSEGKCLPSLTPVTVTSTVVQTVTRIATQRATVVIAEIERSTIFSTVDVTISTAATQTNVVWVTVTATALAERAVAGFDSPQPSTSGNAASIHDVPKARDAKRSDHVETRLSDSRSDAAPIRRQADQGAAPTVTSYITQTTEVMSISSTIITVHTTSTEVTTVHLTNTRVLKAETTTTITSTLTLTTHPPSTATLTTTASSIIPPPSVSSNTHPSTSPNLDSDTQALTTPTIAGIAASSSVLALLLAGFVVLAIRRRHRRHNSPDQDVDAMFYASGYSGYDGGSGGGVAERGVGIGVGRQPTIPVLPHFAVLPPAHHAVEYRLPVDAGTAGVGHYGGGQFAGEGYLSVNKNQAAVNGEGAAGGHQRNGSGYTTLVGTPSPTSARFEFDAGGERKGKGVDVAEMQGSAAEVPGARWVEADGTPPAGVSPSPIREGARQGEESWPLPTWPLPSSGLGSTRMLGQGYQRNRRETVGELDGDCVVRELDRNAIRRGG